MSEVFDTSYDRTTLGTREELSVTLGVKPVSLAKILTESNVPVVGTVRTGQVGKPPSLFRVTEARVAVEAHNAKVLATKAAAAAARKLKTKQPKVATETVLGDTQVVNTDEPVASVETEVAVAQ